MRQDGLIDIVSSRVKQLHKREMALSASAMGSSPEASAIAGDVVSACPSVWTRTRFTTEMLVRSRSLRKARRVVGVQLQPGHAVPAFLSMAPTVPAAADLVTRMWALVLGEGCSCAVATPYYLGLHLLRKIIRNELGKRRVVIVVEIDHPSLLPNSFPTIFADTH